MTNLIFMPSGLSYIPDFAKALSDDLRLTPVLWLGDSRHNSWARQNFPDCVVLEGAGLEQMEGLEKVVSQEAAQLALSFIQSKSFATQKDALHSEFNRLPRWKLTRQVDREVHLRRLLLQFAQYFIDLKPDLLVSSETPHNPFALSLFSFTQWMGVPTLFFQPTTALAPALLPRTDLDQVFDFEENVATRGSDATRIFLRGEFESGVANLMAGRSTRLQQDERNQRNPTGLSSSSFLDAPGKYLDYVKNKLRRVLVWLQTGFLREFLLWMVNLCFATDLRRAYGKLRHDALGSSFALLGLHFQPERTSVPEGDYALAFQGDAVLLARKFVPIQTALVVKEHESQIDPRRKGHLGRSAFFYQLVSTLPNTQMIGGAVRTIGQLGRAECVLTVTGSIGIEAALNRVPVVFFGQPWWSGLPGTRLYDSSLHYETVVKSLKTENTSEKVQDFLRTRVLEKSIPGFGVPSQEKFWGRSVSIPADFIPDSIGAALEVVRQVVSNTKSQRA